MTPTLKSNSVRGYLPVNRMAKNAITVTTTAATCKKNKTM
ncbi:Uncharacterised protein [Mycobacterium tuberculosis]|uniref:Uncharacterized protein n=1 Tax=Mycobacterium tuberculosis TaxID=1773 RepID=A0A916L7T2_MYCTX|nr:Uncharacterised protein [Mycobacterium tuberculosis]COW90136.1 Uncharacterised protein [Mycobacterium tuberculosis]CPA85961.1 Uncharacterised protein [Mycobacterium tuberculosis]CPB82539.1 Uncharacterised protein [Mycobacterium tuberculosis]